MAVLHNFKAKIFSSPLKVEDDDVDNLDIEVNVVRKSKRVYQSPSPEVGLKISRSLKVVFYICPFLKNEWNIKSFVGSDVNEQRFMGRFQNFNALDRWSDCRVSMQRQVSLASE